MIAREHNFSFLLVALLIMLIGMPMLDDAFGWRAPVLRAGALSGVLIVGVGSLRGSRREWQAGLVLVITGVLLNVSNAASTGSGFSQPALLCFLAFVLLTIVAVGRHVFFSSRITANRIVGAACIYLLLGALWTTVYSLLYGFDPGAFRGLQADDALIGLQDFQYYSLVTLTTLGYGDIVPVTPTARALTVVEAVCGQFYLAIIVAGLVGSYIAARLDKSPR